MDGLVSRLNSAKGSYEEPMQFLKDRAKWTNMLTELEQRMPDMMWVTTLEGVGDEVPNSDGAAGSPDSPFGGSPFGGPAFGGSPFGPGGEGGMMSGPESNLPPSPADITEVKQIRLVGYTLIMGANLLEQEFQKRLKDSTFFSDADDGSVLVKYAPETDTLNLSSFEMLVKLKEPIKK